MSKVVAIMSMSLDGYVADLDDGVAEVFDWYFNSGDVEFHTGGSDPMTFKVSGPSAEHLRGLWSELGAVLTGRRTFEVAHGWGGIVSVTAPRLPYVREIAPGVWAAVVWQSWANSLFGYAAWNWLLSRYPAATVTPLALLIPVFGIGASAVWLGEPLPMWKLAAAALVIGGLAINLLWPRAPAGATIGSGTAAQG